MCDPSLFLARALKPALGSVQEMSRCIYPFPGIIIDQSLNGGCADMAIDTSLASPLTRGFDGPTVDNMHVFTACCKTFGALSLLTPDLRLITFPPFAK